MPLKTEMRLVTIVGSGFYPGAPATVAALRPGDRVRIVREPQNPYDPNALAVYSTAQGRVPPGKRMEDLPLLTKLGHLPRGFAAEVAPLVDQGMRIDARKPSDPRFREGAMVQVVWEIPPGETNGSPTPDPGANR